MRFAAISLVTAIISLLLATKSFGEIKETELQHALDGVKWADSVVPLSDMKGKSVVILVYDTQRGRDDWPIAFLAELKAAVHDRPIVVLAINSDRKAELDLSFMKALEFSGPNIFHGGSSLLAAQLGLKSSHFIYVLIDSSGKVVRSETAGMHFDRGEPRFELTRRICQSKELGGFSIIDTSMSDKLKVSLWQYEFGKVPSADEMKKLSFGLSDKDKKLVDKGFDRYLDAEVTKLSKLSAGSAEDRVAAFGRAKSLFLAFGSKPQAEQLKQIGKDLKNSPGFDKELAAKQAYEKAMQQSAKAKNPDAIRPRLLLSVARQYKGTVYGRMATATGSGAGSKNGDAKNDVLPESIRVWKESSDAENKAAVAKQKAFFTKLQEKFPDLPLKSYETKQFLFFSDLSPQFINTTCLPYLDAMYAQLCVGYGLDSSKSIWRGKATIVAFANELNFHEFEQEFYHSTKLGAQGLAHSSTNKTAKATKAAKAKPTRFQTLIDGIKAGMPWEDSLLKAYNLTPVQLAQVYGESIGIPDLKP